MFRNSYIILQNSCLSRHRSLRLATRISQRLRAGSRSRSTFPKRRAQPGGATPAATGRAGGAVGSVPPQERRLPGIGAAPDAAQHPPSCGRTGTSPVFCISAGLPGRLPSATTPGAAEILLMTTAIFIEKQKSGHFFK